MKGKIFLAIFFLFFISISSSALAATQADQLLGNTTNIFYYRSSGAASTPSAATTVFTDANYNSVNVSDNSRYTLTATATKTVVRYAYNRFTFNLNGYNFSDTNATFCIEGYYSNTLDSTNGYARVYFYNTSSSAWTQFATFTTSEATYCQAFSNISTILNATNYTWFGTELWAIGDGVSGSTTTEYIDFINLTIRYNVTGGGDTTPPTFSNPSINTTCANKPVNISITISDEIALSGYIFSTNNTGTWVNTTWTSLSSGSLATNTTILNSTAGTVVNYTWYANDSSNNWAVRANSTTTTDCTSPMMTIDSPANATYYDATNIWQNVTLDETASWCGVSIDGAANQTLTNSTGNYNYMKTGLAYSSHNSIFYCNDTSGNWNSSIVYYKTQDITSPTVTMQSPTNQTYPTSSVWANVSLDETGSWCGRSLDGAANVTMTNSSGNWNNQMTSLSDGSHDVRFYCNDTSGNMNGSSSNIIYFTVDTIPPIIYVQSPINETQYEDVTEMWHNSTLNEVGSWCGVSIDGAANQTLTNSTGNYNYLKNGMSYTLHNATFYCNDTSGNMNSSYYTYRLAESISPTYYDCFSNPVNNTAVNTGSSITFGCRWTDNYQLIYYRNYSKVNDSGSWVNSDWRVFLATGNWTNITINFPTEENSNISTKIQVVDPFGNSNTTNNWFWWNYSYIDTTPPIITIQSPLNVTYTNIGNNSVWANATLDEVGSWCGVVNDTNPSNISMTNSTGNYNYLFSGISEGPHSFKFYCNDTADNMNSTTVYFTTNTSLLTICQNITVGDKTYWLGNSVAISSTTCFEVKDDNVKLDCLGYSIVTTGNWSNGVKTAKNNLTVRNCNVSTSGYFSYGLYAYEYIIPPERITFTSNNVTTFNSSSIYIETTTNSTVTYNVIYSQNKYGIEMSDTNSSNISYNNITGNAGILLVDYINVNDVFSSNIINTDTGFRIGLNTVLMGGNNNTITGGSITGSSIDYYLISSGMTNNFIDTNFTGQRKIYFYNASSVFNYNNQTNGNIWIKTNTSGEMLLSRELLNWNSSLMQWNDTSYNNTYYNEIMNYKLTGLVNTSVYSIYDNSTFMMNLTTDSNGILPQFSINLTSTWHNMRIVYMGITESISDDDESILSFALLFVLVLAMVLSL